ncbi:DUF2293 domain-containing protein [candidate division KSB1 bacterium]|nr:DUF2293 domain-containing protein [candidate division KSB1 bacterium]
MKQSNDLKVFISNRDFTCDDCGEKFGRKSWITLQEEKGALCLVCADLDHLIFLPSGDTALTRRARKYSTLVAIVLKWSRARKRYERQGLLVEEQALDQAEEECLADSEVRDRRKERAAQKRAEIDEQYVQVFAEKVRKLFPGSPLGRENIIAEHACFKYSGRIGRTESAKKLDEEAILLAVVAHIRHTETKYDEFLSKGYERREARGQVEEKVHKILREWK